MLFIVSSVIILIAAVIPRMWEPRAADPTLGWMSEQWLLEHRASTPL